MKIVLKLGVALFFMFFSFISCAEDKECRTEKNVQMLVSFYQIVPDTTKIPIEGRKDSLVIKQVERVLPIDSLSVWGLDLDSVLYKGVKGLSSVKLPLRKLNEETEFIFSFRDIKDTVSISSDVLHNFISFECGYLTSFKIKDINTTTNFIDSVVLKTPDVNVTHVENIKIYHTSK